MFKPLSCVFGNFVVQQRYVLVFMTFMAIVNCYNTRMCLHIAITEITIPVHHNDTIPGACPGNHTNETIHGGSYDWSERQQGVILLAFFPGYLIMHLPSGLLADKYGGRHVLSSGVLISAILTFLTPAAIKLMDWYGLILTRFLMGLAQAGMYPAITALLARWIPARQRSQLGSLVYSGIQVGIITGTLFSGLILEYSHNWPLVFYVWGLLSLLWYIFFLFMCFSDPDSHPFITSEEKEMLANEFGHKHMFKTPWKPILKDKGVWALILAQCGHDWITYTVEIDMPKYFKNVLKLSVAKNAMVTSAPFAAMWVCSAATGYLSDFLINKYGIKVVTMRILYTTISSAGPSIFALLAVYMGCNKQLVVALFWIGMVSMGPYYPGLKVNVLDLSLNFSGMLMSLANGIGVITGIAAPYVVAEVAANQTVHEWQNVFWITLIICTLTNIVYIVWASAERCVWDYEPEIIPPAR